MHADADQNPEHELHMRSCLKLARSSLIGQDTPVGSLIVKDGRVIGEGAEAVRAKLDPTAHAEIEALRSACLELKSTDLTGCTLYTTVEPCVMCAYAIRLARVSIVVSGTRSSSRHDAGAADAVLNDANLLPGRKPPLSIRGILSLECNELLRERKQGS